MSSSGGERFGVKLLLIDLLFLKTSKVNGSDPLNIGHLIESVDTIEILGMIASCPHVSVTNLGDTTGENAGGIIFGATM